MARNNLSQAEVNSQKQKAQKWQNQAAEVVYHLLSHLITVLIALKNSYPSATTLLQPPQLLGRVLGRETANEITIS